MPESLHRREKIGRLCRGVALTRRLAQRFLHDRAQGLGKAMKHCERIYFMNFLICSATSVTWSSFMSGKIGSDMIRFISASATGSSGCVP